MLKNGWVAFFTWRGFRFRIPQYGALLDASPVGQMLQQMLIGVDAAAATRLGVQILPSEKPVNRWGCWKIEVPPRWLRCHQKCSRRWCRKWINRPIDPQFLASKKNTFDTHTYHPITALFVHGIIGLRSWLPVWQWDIWPTFSQRLMQRSGRTWGQPFGWTGEPCNSQNLRSHETPVNACWSTGTRMRILTCQCRPGWVNSQVDSEREEARNP